MIMKEEMQHGDTMAIKSLLLHPLTFIYSQFNINSGDTMEKVKRICKQCNKAFEIYPSMLKEGKGSFCSKECQNLGQLKPKIKRICEQCGMEFETHPSQIKAGHGRFCSRDCFHKYQTGENNPNWQGGGVDRICKQCGKKFQKHPSQIKKEGGIFCSNECHNEYRKKREILTCETCGKKFEARKSEKGRKFCSFQCYLRRQKTQNHLTKPELIFEEICKKNNLDFHYVGDGQLWIGKRKKLNPDFIEANGKKICIEIMGRYWHSPLLNRNLRESALLPYREKHYKKYKWQSIFIWDTDLLREDSEQFVLNVLEKQNVAIKIAETEQ